MTWFSWSRSEGYPTHYPDQHTTTPIDKLTVGLSVAWLILGLSFYSILPAYSKRIRSPLLLRILVAIFTGGVILCSNYGHDWETGYVHMITPYKPSSHEEIKGHIGLHITLRGFNITLRGFNITLRGTPMDSKSHLTKERINYNEHFLWEWAQFRLGFGYYYAGQVSRDFRAASVRGVPLPIVQIAEYFTFDGEGIRLGRYYRLAGWYTHQLMWTSLGTWLISNILFSMIITTAAYFLILTGLLQLAAIVVWTFLRNPIEIQIPLESDTHQDILLKTHYGLDYYLVLGNGIFCILLGFVVFLLDCWIPEETCRFFGIDRLSIYEESHLSSEEAGLKSNVPQRSEVCMMEMGGELDFGSNKKVSFHDGEVEEGEESQQGVVVLKRRDNVASKLFRASFKIKPKVRPRVQATKEFGTNQLGKEEKTEKPLLGNPSDSDTSEDESWPRPPSKVTLRKPPTPPPKRSIK